VLPKLVSASDTLDPSKLRRPDGSFDLQTVASVSATLDQSVQRLTEATSAVTASQPSWLSPVASGRTGLITALNGLSADLTSADQASHIAPAMLGATGTKQYIVVFQNEAEARGTGGLPGAFGIAKVTNGKVSFTQFHADNYLGTVPTSLDFGPDYQQMYGQAETTSLYVNSNMSPNFPYPAQIWIAMWKAKTGQQLDGAVAVDSTLLSYLLQVTGPVTLPDGTRLTAANVVSLTQSAVYAKFAQPSQNAARKQYLLDVARTASDHLIATHTNTTALIKAAAKGAGQRRILVYSTDPAIESRLVQTSLGGQIPETGTPYTGLVVTNMGGDKLDYYLQRSMTWQTASCSGTRDVTVTVTLTNTAPGTGLSPYVTARSDRHPAGVQPGDARDAVNLYTTAGATMSSVTVDGKPGTAYIDTERGHPVYTVDLELPHGATRTIVYHLRESGAGAPEVLNQPLVNDAHITIDAPHCNAG
jgi:hypothetical protein